MSLNHMSKPTKVHPGNRILFNNKNEPTIDACNNFDECQTHYAEGKKPDAKGLMRQAV